MKHYTLFKHKATNILEVSRTENERDFPINYSKAANAYNTKILRYFLMVLCFLKEQKIIKKKEIGHLCIFNENLKCSFKG